MMEPRIQYAKTSDGVSIAYAVFGDGPPLVIPPALFASHLQLEWEMPNRRKFYERLAERATVIRYDPPGMGMSQRDAVDFSSEANTRGLEAVVDKLGLERFALFARPTTSDVPLAYAAREGQRVTHLLLSGLVPLENLGVGGGLKPFLLSFLSFAAQEWELFTNVYARLAAGWDSPDATPLAALIRASATPDSFRAAFEAAETSDPFAFASQIRVPTLILHPLGDEAAAGAAARLATRITTAQVAGIPGPFFRGYPNTAGIAAIHNFISASPGARAQAVVAHELETGAFRTILFTDIVEHTAMMERLGDEAGRDVLREHERITREALRANSGSEIKTIGDSFMASFSSAQKALECAIALQRTFASNDICGEQVRIRAGINAGEPITEGDDLFGASVILAARSKESAGAGEIVVTDVVRQLVTGKGFLFAERGEVALRGFEDPVRLYEVRWREAD